MAYIVALDSGSYATHQLLGEASAAALGQKLCGQCGAKLDEVRLTLRYPGVRPCRDIYLKAFCADCLPAVIGRIRATLAEGA